MSYITNPQNIKSHPFYPFIKNELVLYRRKPDENGDHKKRRPIMYASHVDANIYSYYGAMLGQHYEAQIRNSIANDAVLAYRKMGPGINNVSFSQAAFDEIRRRGTCVALAFDVIKFFDKLDHGILRKQWCQVLGATRLPDDHFQVFKSLTQFSFVERKPLCVALGIDPKREREISRYCDAAEFRKVVRKKANLIQTNKDSFGIPQGSPMSAILSNIYMLEADERLATYAKSINGSYRRYCDDILLICKIEHLDQAEAAVKSELQQLGLDINERKTEKTIFIQTPDGSLTIGYECKPLQYLGFVFDGKNVRVRSQSLARYYRKMKSGVKAAAQSAKRRPTSGFPMSQLYTNYTHLGRRNFFSYAKGASLIMGSAAIRRQISRHWKKLDSEIKDRQANINEQTDVAKGKSC